MTLHWMDNEGGAVEVVPISAPSSVSTSELLDVWDEVVEDDIYNLNYFVQPGDTWLDVGCHLGFFSIAARMSGARAIQMVDSNQERLRHGLWNARQHAVLASADGGVLSDRGGVFTGGWAYEVKGSADLPAYGGERWSGIKLDIQGSEREVFAGEGAAELKLVTKSLVYEYHYDDLDEHVKHMQASGWDVIDTKPHKDVLLGIDTWIVWARSLA